MDKRANDRHRVASTGMLRSGGAEIPCAILDVSSTGARIRVAPGGFLSNDCHLASALLSDVVPGRIVWRRGAEIGLRFKGVVRPKLTEERRSRQTSPVVVGSWRKRGF